MEGIVLCSLSTFFFFYTYSSASLSRVYYIMSVLVHDNNAYVFFVSLFKHYIDLFDMIYFKDYKWFLFGFEMCNFGCVCERYLA